MGNMKKIVNKSLIKKIISIIIYAILITVLAIILVQRISNNKLSFFGYRIFRVISESMVPEYNINDILLVKEKNLQDIEIGDDISFQRELNGNSEAVITHRVVNIEKDSEGNLKIHTKGIANTIEDPILRKEQIYGVVVNKFYFLSFINKLINNLYGFIVLVFIPLLVLICLNIKNLITLFKERNNEK